MREWVSMRVWTEQRWTWQLNSPTHHHPQSSPHSHLPAPILVNAVVWCAEVIESFYLPVILLIDSGFNWRYNEWLTYLCPSRNLSLQQIILICSTERLNQIQFHNHRKTLFVLLTNDNKVMLKNSEQAILDVLDLYLDH